MADDIKILVVDDETVVIRSCERVLKAEGYNVEGALSGREAIAKMEKNTYNLVLTDLKMPEMDGISLIRWMRKERPNVGIVIITGYPSQETIKEALELGIIDYVPKPFTPAVLTDVTNRAVEWIKGKATVEEGKPPEVFPPSMAAELDKVIKEYKDIPGSLILVLQRAQELVGYLPPVVQKRISKGLNIPAAEIHSVVSFYAFFTMKPRGEHLIRVCLGTACYTKKSEAVLEKFISELGVKVEEVTPDKKFSLETVRCIGACGLAPAVVVDEDTYALMHPKKVREVINVYR